MNLKLIRILHLLHVQTYMCIIKNCLDASHYSHHYLNMGACDEYSNSFSVAGGAVLG